MAQLRKIGFQSELKTSSTKFFNFLTHDLGNIAQLFPEHVKCSQLIEGNFYTAGSMILVKYAIGTLMSLKVKIEAIDEAEKCVVYEFTEGDMLKFYKSAKVKIQLADGSVKWELFFEKANEAVPDPDHFVSFAAKVLKDMDTYLCKN